MRKHRDALRDVNARNVPSDLYGAARTSWDDAIELGEQFGYRNAQTTVLAPTGTIGFMMDCDTTGVEPDIALVKLQEAGRWWFDEDRQSNRTDGASQAWLHASANRGHHRAHRQERDHRRRPGVEKIRIFRSSIARSKRRRATGPSTIWATSR